MATPFFFPPGGSPHGQVKKVEGGKLYIVTAPGSKPEEVDLSKIQRINFDPTYTNIGPAPAELHMGGSDNKEKTAVKISVAPVANDTVILVGDREQPCTLTSIDIDKNEVRCATKEGKELKWPRQPDVTDIQVGSRP